MAELLLFWNEKVDIETRSRCDNSSVVGHVHSIYSVTKGRMPNGFLESNSEELDINQWLALSRIAGGLDISDEMAKPTTRNKLVTLSAMNIPQAAIEGNRDVIRKSYPSDKQYLAYPETSGRRKYLRKFTRRRDGAGSWGIIEKVALFLINFII